MDESHSESWLAAQRIFTEARELPDAEREAFIRRECGTDADVLAEVRALLAVDGRAQVYFEDLEGHLPGRSEGPPSLVGRTLGRFEVTGALGRGGMGHVYRARDLSLGRQVALKVLPPHLAGEAEHVTRFRHEARMLAALNHPNIAGIHDVEEIDGLTLLVLELVEGVSLRQRLDAGPLPVEEALDVGRQIAGALEAAHDAGIVHRDLKPSNVAIASDGRPYVLDFGIAKSLERLRRGAVRGGRASPPPGDQTLPGAVIGTAPYMSPEQARAEAVDERSDIWAFGALLFEMLTGHRAFGGSDLVNIVAAVLEGEPDWSALPTATPPAVRGLMQRCLDRDMRRRLQAIGEARIVLETVRGGGEMPGVAEQSASDGDSSDDTPATETTRGAVPSPAGVRSKRLRPWAWTALVLPGLVVLGMLITGERAPMPSAELLAIGEISDYLGGEDPPAAAALSDMLATNLARVDGMRVVSAARMLEIAPPDLPRGGSLAAAARRAGATAVIEGGLHRGATGRYRLDLRVVHLEDGEILEAFTLQGPDLFALVDSGTSRIAARLGSSAPSGSIREVTTSSEMAYTLYREGLRLHFAGDRPGAEAMLSAALREDPGFAMAAYWGSIVTVDDFGRSLRLLARADTLAEKAPDRERWLIRARKAQIGGEPRVRAYADSLVRRYPEEPDGWALLARSLVSEGAYEEALPVLRRVLEEIGPDEPPNPAVCRTCNAYALLANTYALLDSADARRQVAEAWTRDYPEVPAAWRLLAVTLSSEGLHAAADSARERAYDLDGSFDADRSIRVGLAMTRGDLEAAVASARAEAEGAAPDWWLTSYVERARGRWEEAMEAALYARASYGGTGALPPGAADPAALSQAVTLRMAGRPREAAALFDSLAAWRHGAAPQALGDRQRAWMLVQRADALALAGDVAELPSLADEIQRLGATSGQIRDRRMHWHVRGLWLLAEGDTLAATEAFRRSVFSLSQGYTRTNQVWAEVLLAQGEAGSAIPLLQQALLGAIEGSTFYTNPADSHRLLAEAWSRMPGPEAVDSARAHREWGR